jgi:NTP pyrophosphatase (non-canonical NTP hydrolase)
MKLERDYAGIIRQCIDVCHQRGWSLHWTARGVYLHLEASELIEAWRGKGVSTVAQEAGDVLLVLFSILGTAGVSWDDALQAAIDKMEELKVKPHYPGEEYSADLIPASE